MHEGTVEDAAVTDIVHTAIVVVDSVGHVVVGYFSGLFDGEEFLVTSLIALFFLVVDVTGYNKAIVLPGRIDGNNVFALVNLVDTFFKSCHARLEIVAFCLEESFLHFVQIDFAGCDFNFRLALVTRRARTARGSSRARRGVTRAKRRVSRRRAGIRRLRGGLVVRPRLERRVRAGARVVGCGT